MTRLDRTNISFSSLFRRDSGSNTYLPFVDGIRLVAVALVVGFHFLPIYEQRYGPISTSWAYTLFRSPLQNGNIGVDIFFFLSAFILGHNALAHKEKHGVYQALSTFYKRRFWRIYPPFAIAMLMIFVGNVWVMKKESFQDLLPSLISTLTYTNNLASSFFAMPVLSMITWTLEVEIQFYLFFPLFRSVLDMPMYRRRLWLLMGVVLFTALKLSTPLPFTSLYDCLPMFLAGLFLADVYFHDKERSLKSGLVYPLLAGLSLAYPLYMDLGQQSLRFFYPFLILAFFYFSLNSVWVKTILSKRWLCTIGGMCYSIYLLHPSIIALASRLFLPTIFSNFALLDHSIWLLINFLMLAVICSVFYVFAEKPFMGKR